MHGAKGRIRLLRGDITKISADAIVNAANSSLLGGGGVDGAIHRAGGQEILAGCMEIRARQGSCPTGEAVITRAGKLPARFVIHAVGPVWQGGGKGEAEILAGCYRSALQLAVENGCRTIAFPCISTGIYGYPKSAAAGVAAVTVTEFLAKHDGISEVLLICYDEENYRCLETALRQIP